MENNRILRVVSVAKLEFKRKIEKPMLIWLDNIQVDLKIIRIKGWRRKTQDRSE
jgi:hypothetical protein